jgi:streptogramin lyase
MKKVLIVVVALGVIGWANSAVDVSSVAISGTIADAAGKPISGATVTLFDGALEKSISVYSQSDGKFGFGDLAPRTYRLRARLLGFEDTWTDLAAGNNEAVRLTLEPAAGIDLQLQRTPNARLDLLAWESEEQSLNFKMMCAYCHQVGTEGFRTPEEPVDWEVMVTRMDGFRGLQEHTRGILVDKLLATYGLDAEQRWPAWQPPAPPQGPEIEARITEWLMSKEDDAMVHDLEIGKDGLVYIVDMTNDAVETLDPTTGERALYPLPGGKDYKSLDPPIKGPHSIEVAANGDMWITLALSGEMAKFDPKTKEFTYVSGHPTAKRGGYPHTLRIDQRGIVWYTDAGLGVFSLDPATMKVKGYQLPSANQVRGEGRRGESRGVTPYGISIAPDGKVWYTKLNGQRVGRVDPTKPDGDPLQVVEWQPPVHGPRRLEVAADGLVWVPGWASGDIASFREETEEWKVYPLPKGPNSLPYALSVHPKTGEIWICGTGTDSMVRFDPKTEKFVEYRLPTRVTYTREVEFDDQGHIWVSNSNYPVRHVENHRGSVIRVETM